MYIRLQDSMPSQNTIDQLSKIKALRNLKVVVDEPEYYNFQAILAIPNLKKLTLYNVHSLVRDSVGYFRRSASPSKEEDLNQAIEANFTRRGLVRIVDQLHSSTSASKLEFVDYSNNKLSKKEEG